MLLAYTEGVYRSGNLLEVILAIIDVIIIFVASLTDYCYESDSFRHCP